MKKHAIIITTAALLAVFASGCAQNNAQTTTSAAETTAAAAAPETTTTTTEATTTTTKAAEMPTLPAERLFGGSVASDNAVDIYISADESSDVTATIPAWTQIEIYESGIDGWYLTEFDGKTGYIKSELVNEIPAYDMNGAYEPTIADIVGRWIYEEPDAAYTEGYRGVPIGLFIINDDGSFSFTTDGSSYETGTVSVTYEEYSDGSRVPWFSFYDGNGTLFMACAAVAPSERTDGCLYIGQDGIARLVPDNGNAAGGTDNYSVPNEYGFYELKNPPASGVSIAALEGTWYDAKNPTQSLVISRTDDLYYGTFTAVDSDGNIAEGCVKLEYALNPDDTPTFWYTFYINNNILWNAFGVSGDIPLTDLYSGQDGATHLVRPE